MKKYILFCFVVLGMASCASIEFLEIDVQKPAQNALPQTVQKVGVVNNAGIQPDNVGHKTKNYINETEIRVANDSINEVLTDALAQFLDEEGYFDKVSSFDRALRKDNSFLSERPIDPVIIRQISEALDAEAIISLDRLIMFSELNSERIGNGLTADVIKLFIDAKFRTYSNEGVLLSSPVLFQDTLSWNGIRDGSYYLTDDLPTREGALYQGALYVASEMVKMFTPYWEKQNRWYYTNGGTQMRKASMKASVNDWRDAAIIWGELYEKEKNTKNKAKLASNIALANEMLDDIENALNWTKISSELFSSTIKQGDSKTVDVDIIRVEAYMQELRNRMGDFKKLDVQNEDIDEIAK